MYFPFRHLLVPQNDATITMIKQDHIQEIIDKWLAIDDEIWAKIICMERNRRIAKAYARKHSLTVNGSEDEYLDGTTLGLNSFENQDRDTKTRHIKQYIGQVSISSILPTVSRLFKHKRDGERERKSTCKQFKLLIQAKGFRCACFITQN